MASESEIISRLAEKHAVPEDAVQVLLVALRRGGGTMAQFSHQAFGGMSQWSKGGMTMVGDMFNDGLKAKLNALADDLASQLPNTSEAKSSQQNDQPSYAARTSTSWWPGTLGHPSSAGSQNTLRYAIFPDARRLAIDDGGTVTLYDTGTHRIYGISQEQNSTQTLVFDSQEGRVKVSELPKIKE